MSRNVYDKNLEPVQVKYSNKKYDDGASDRKLHLFDLEKEVKEDGKDNMIKLPIFHYLPLSQPAINQCLQTITTIDLSPAVKN